MNLKEITQFIIEEIEWVIGTGLLALFVFLLLPSIVIPSILYNKLFVRTGNEKWTRDVSDPEDKIQVEMYEDGKEWIKDYIESLEYLDIESEGFHLYGQYLNQGTNKAVIIIPGRTEALIYSYYFAKPYYEMGYNILFIDNRAHGMSEGKYSSVGLKEYKDILNWAKKLHEKYNNDSIIIHGICIGAATGIYALTSKEKPDYLNGLIAEGMYDTFYESLKNHIIERDKPVHPYCDILMWMFEAQCGRNPKYHGPIHYVDKLDCPLLMLNSRADIYSLPEKAQQIFEKCKSEKKKIVYFVDAAHSKVRHMHKEKYDNAIKEFLKENF